MSAAALEVTRAGRRARHPDEGHSSRPHTAAVVAGVRHLSRVTCQVAVATMKMSFSWRLGDILALAASDSVGSWCLSSPSASMERVEATVIPFRG
ncbi:unnamed protein product [Arctogadus glacialis]